MRVFIGSIMSVLIAGAAAGDWQAELSRKPGTFAPLRPLRATYDFGWSGFKAARAEVDFSRTKLGQYQLAVKGASTGAARALWKMDSSSTSIVRPKALLPVELVQTEVYSDETRKTTVVFSPEAVSRTRETKPADDGSGKTKRFKFAPVHDLHSALLFVRSQALEQGNSIRLVVYPAAEPYLADIEVLGRETINAAGHSWPAIKLGIKLQKVTKKLNLEPHKNFKKAIAWLSDDSDRLLLKIETEVMVGKVWMNLASYQFGENAAGK
jgi:Protein of unknown function (DUF3108)